VRVVRLAVMGGCAAECRRDSRLPTLTVSAAWWLMRWRGILARMSDVTRILERIERGEPQAAEKLLPLVYDELRRLAAQMMAHENIGQTLQPTALVHEAYLRLVGGSRGNRSDRNDDVSARGARPRADRAAPASPPATGEPNWQNRRHFFAAAAEAMRRILVENARRKGRLKRGGQRVRQQLDSQQLAATESPDDVMAVHEALGALERVNPQVAELVKLRYFAGCTIPEAAGLLGISPRKANQLWAYARVWLLDKLAE